MRMKSSFKNDTYELPSGTFRKIDDSHSNGFIVDKPGDQRTNNSANQTPTPQQTDDESPKTSKKPARPPAVGFLELFKYADSLDRMLLFFGTVSSLIVGAAMPINLMFYGEAIDIFITDYRIRLNYTIYSNNQSAVEEPPITIKGDTYTDISAMVWKFAMIGGIVFLFGFFQISSFQLAAERLVLRIRKLFFRSVLRQHVGWFDVHQSGELNSQLVDNVQKISNGISMKLAMFLQWMTTFLVGYIIGFVRGWKLTLVIISLSPLIIVCLGGLIIAMRVYIGKEMAAYGKAGAVANEVLASIKTVMAFGGEDKEVKRYGAKLEIAKKVAVKKGVLLGSILFALWIVLFGSFSLGFWYGTKLAIEEPDTYTGGVVIQIFLAVLTGTMALGQAAPNLEEVASARGAAVAVYKVIDSKSEIDSLSESGVKPSSMQGVIEINEVDFKYPSRDDVQVLQGFSLRVNSGETVALVGESGCGKSTCIQLLQRFYDPQCGQVKVDGYDVRELNVGWLRSNIGVVSQEPVLFDTSIYENIKYGNLSASRDDIQRAARAANAHSFISSLPQGYDTQVGSRGTQLSGGQKQRIAIARALVRNPKILLLDEATSALDTESESVVQKALDSARKGRTSIIIAHRLSTIRNADRICGVQNGRVVETGTHEQLMNTEGLYYQMVKGQKQSMGEEIPEISTYENYEELQTDTDYKRNLLRERTISGSSTGSIRRGDRKRASFARQKSAPPKSVDEAKTAKKLEKEYEKTLSEAPVSRIMKMGAPEWAYTLTGVVFSMAAGIVQPAIAFIMADNLKLFGLDEKRAEEGSVNIAVTFIIVGVVIGFANFMQTFGFTISGERLTERVRLIMFQHMLKQDIEWFEGPYNQVGSLTARLSGDASSVRGASGRNIGYVLQSLTTMGSAVVIAFVYSWKLALVILAFAPLLVLGGYIQGRVMSLQSQTETKKVSEAGKVSQESIENIRTVAGLGREQTFFEQFEVVYLTIYLKAKRKAMIIGSTFSFSNCIIYFLYAVAFSYGSTLIDDNEVKYFDVFRVFSAITFASQAIGRLTSYQTDLVKGKVAAAKMFALLDSSPTVDVSSDKGIVPRTNNGEIRFNNVRFSYPSRQDVTVLKDMSLTLKPGQTVALVGESGCGKSTTIQLLQRFYAPASGTVTVAGENIQLLNTRWLRSQMGIVSQEPVLFDLSISQNIAYGDNTRQVDQSEIVSAAKMANIHQFISELPAGYETNVGDKGTQLSGGQKQRVAIARAILRNPRILLLDEATSALDNESEKIVQEALDRAQQGRTSLVIAHRLSTIQEADLIVVIHNGAVVEQGTHHELLRAEGYYYRLHNVNKMEKHISPVSPIVTRESTFENVEL